MRGGSAMKKLLLASIATLLLIDGRPALSADFPIHVRQPVLIPAFTWSSCYLGAQVGYGWSHKDMTDPVELVQDSIVNFNINNSNDLGLPLTSPVNTAGLNPNGYIVGGQFGCDYQFAGSNWVIGFEGSITGGNLKGETTVALPLGDPGDHALVTARADFIPSGTVRVGYAWDRWLLYAKAGAAGVSDRYSISGVFLASNPTNLSPFFNFQGVDLRIGWTAGCGLEWAFWEDWSVKVEYDYYGFGHQSVLMTDSINFFSPVAGAVVPVFGNVDIKQSVQTVKVGLNFHMWSTRW
jgi:outer membrane immunogenic protein